MNTSKSICLVALLFCSVLGSPAQSENFELISRFETAFNGGPGGNLPSFAPSVNGDGTVVVFEAAGDFSIPGNVPSMHDVHIYDALQDTLVNLTFGGNDHSGQPDISSDGRYIAFVSSATNLHPEDANGSVTNLFLYDRELDELAVVTPDQNSGFFNRAMTDVNAPTVRISGDGQFIAFATSATNLTNDADNSLSPLYLWERETNEFVSVLAGANSGAQPGLDISEDGSWLVLSTFATNLTDETLPDEGLTRLFIYNTADGTFTQLPGTEGALYPSISGDGRYVAFVSQIDGRPGPSGGVLNDVYLLDRMTGDRRLITPNGDNSSWSPALNADGSQLAFRSQANNLLPNDDNGNWDIFVYETDTGVLQQITEGSDGININPAISGDGNTVSFASAATNLLPEGEDNGILDMYVWRRDGASPEPPCDLFPAGVLRSTSGASIELAGATQCPTPGLVNLGPTGPRGLSIPADRGRPALNLIPDNESTLPDGDFIFYRYPLLDGSAVYVASFVDQRRGYPVSMSFRSSNLREFELLELAVFSNASRSRNQLIYVEHGSSWSFEPGETSALVSIEGNLFLDSNDNSVRDPQENLFRGSSTSVTLFYCGDRDGVVAARGYAQGRETQFDFSGLEPGMYQLGVRLGDNYRFTFGGVDDNGESLQPIRAVSGPPNQNGFTDCVFYGSGAEATLEMGVILRQ